MMSFFLFLCYRLTSQIRHEYRDDFTTWLIRLCHYSSHFKTHINAFDPFLLQNVTIHQEELYLLFLFDSLLNCFNTMILFHFLWLFPISHTGYLPLSFSSKYLLLLEKKTKQSGRFYRYFPATTRSALQRGLFYSSLIDSLAYHRGHKIYFKC